MILEPVEKTIEAADGTERVYILSKFDAISGREIVTQYPISAVPKIGEYKTNEEMMFKIMKFVCVDVNGQQLSLSTPSLIKNHVPDWETLAKIELAMMEYNCSFFRNGKISNFLENLTEKLPQLATSILTDSLQQLSQKTRPHSES